MPGFLFTRVHEGLTDRIPVEVYAKLKRETPAHARRGGIVLDAHFHPEAMGRLEISANDLFKTETARCDYPSRPIVAIGMVNHKRSGYLLLIQGRFVGRLYPTGTSVVSDCVERLQSLPESTLDQSQYRPILEAGGYFTADVLRFRLSPGAYGRAGANLENPDIIQRFEWPRHVEPAPKARACGLADGRILACDEKKAEKNRIATVILK